MKRYIIGWPEYYRRRGSYRFDRFEIISTDNIAFKGKKIKFNDKGVKLKADVYDTEERQYLKRDYGNILDNAIQDYLKSLVATRFVIFEKYSRKKGKRNKNKYK